MTNLMFGKANEVYVLVRDFSKTSDLQTTRSMQAKIWQAAGLILIAGGILVMAWGGWLYYQQQADLYNPPAPIVDSAAMAALEVNPTPTLPPPASPTPPAVTTPALAAISAGSNQVATAEPSSTPTTLPAAPAIATENSLTEIEVAAEITATPTVTTDFNTEDMPSLADNPLMVVEDPAATPPAVSNPSPNVASGPPTRLVAESIGLDTPVIETGWQQVAQDGVSTNVWVVADYAAGWHKNSALPGQGGNVVLSGHHNIKGEVFRYIVDLEVGDTVSLYVGDQRYDYIVNDKFIVKDKGEPDSVRQANARWIGPFNEERLTLVTCWPYTNNTHRVIIIARPS
jgi:LPXTG-site transpeptidase (sortase) family protein